MPIQHSSTATTQMRDWVPASAYIDIGIMMGTHFATSHRRCHADVYKRAVLLLRQL
jgi:hypothetical protein